MQESVEIRKRKERACEEWGLCGLQACRLGPAVLLRLIHPSLLRMYAALIRQTQVVCAKDTEEACGV